MRTVCVAACAAVTFCAGQGAAFAVDPKMADEVESANQLYIEGDYQAALDAYVKARTDCPACAELAYNQGLTHYRLGDMAKAREAFNEALSTSDTTLEARAKYNLGNVAYTESLANQAEAQKAIQSAQSAIEFYRDALALNPGDRDARANIETANQFLKKLREQQQQQQNQQQQDQQKDQDQKQDQQKQDQQNQEQEKNDQPNDEQNSDQQQNDPQSQQQNEQDQQQQDKQAKEGENEQQQDDQQKQGGEQDQQQQADSAEPQGQSQQQPTEARELTEEEAERLLQAVRDKEAKRREQLAERRKAQRVTVDKDW